MPKFGAALGIEIATPVMGKRVDINAPHAGERWWRAVAADETAEAGGNRLQA